MKRPFKPYRLNIEILDEDMIKFLDHLEYGQKGQLVNALLSLARYNQLKFNLNFYSLMEAINGYRNNSGD